MQPCGRCCGRGVALAGVHAGGDLTIVIHHRAEGSVEIHAQPVLGVIPGRLIELAEDNALDAAGCNTLVEFSQLIQVRNVAFRRGA